NTTSNAEVTYDSGDIGPLPASSANLPAGAVLTPGAPNSAAVAATVVGQSIFYNNSAWDGNNPAASASDNLAIATDKSALLPGGTATFANYTSYSKGINGIMVDIANLPAGTTSLSPSDFAFHVGNS